MAAEQWIRAIEDAGAEPDPARSNDLITRLHYRLSEALADELGRVGGPNFHTWAVWGSRKAGVTIRQEDLDSAIRNATATAGIAGSLIGAGTGACAGRVLRWRSGALAAATGGAIGAWVGAWTGRQIAVWSRAEAARVILRGNQTVIQDIGGQSARFLEMLERGARTEERKRFFAGFRRGPTERHGQDRLAEGFRFYLKAFDSKSTEEKKEAMIEGNCQIVLHEHIRLQPYIRDAMPWIVRRCATQRLMRYEIGRRVLLAGEDLPGNPGRTAARNWARIEDRMRYVFALFRAFHADPEVFAEPD